MGSLRRRGSAGDRGLSEAFVVAADPDTTRQLEVPVDRYLHPGAIAFLDHHLRRAEADEVMNEGWRKSRRSSTSLCILGSPIVMLISVRR